MSNEKSKLKTILTSRAKYLDYDVEGFRNIYRAKVPYGIKKGDIFNIYRGESTKNGCEWKGNLEYSLLYFLATEQDD